MDQPINTLQKGADLFLLETPVVPGSSISPTIGDITPEPTFFQKITGPWVSFGKSLADKTTQTYEKLPELLFDWGMEKLGGSKTRIVQEGAGVSTKYVGPPHPGGAPADPNYIVLPPAQVQPFLQAENGKMPTILIIGIIIVIFLALGK